MSYGPATRDGRASQGRREAQDHARYREEGDIEGSARQAPPKLQPSASLFGGSREGGGIAINVQSTLRALACGRKAGVELMRSVPRAIVNPIPLEYDSRDQHYADDRAISQAGARARSGQESRPFNEGLYVARRYGRRQAPLPDHEDDAVAR